MPNTNKKEELNLAPHEWKFIYEALEPILYNSAWSIRHLEGAIQAIQDKIEDRTNSKFIK